eukprot:TRINITY_DN2016_c0_g2_i9.p1 TRINITY_DN2016_c0_g2~~TRINITY_DN2016_c0_g2_i9.p1  ORF type:complete len:521 (+),score=80.49 TRINITY_DN2016_c0_g2_i9:1636-3198(+)
MSLKRLCRYCRGYFWSSTLWHHRHRCAARGRALSAGDSGLISTPTKPNFSTDRFSVIVQPFEEQNPANLTNTGEVNLQASKSEQQPKLPTPSLLLDTNSVRIAAQSHSFRIDDHPQPRHTYNMLHPIVPNLLDPANRTDPFQPGASSPQQPTTSIQGAFPHSILAESGFYMQPSFAGHSLDFQSLRPADTLQKDARSLYYPLVEDPFTTRPVAHQPVFTLSAQTLAGTHPFQGQIGFANPVMSKGHDSISTQLHFATQSTTLPMQTVAMHEDFSPLVGHKVTTEKRAMATHPYRSTKAQERESGPHAKPAFLFARQGPSNDGHPFWKYCVQGTEGFVSLEEGSLFAGGTANHGVEAYTERNILLENSLGFMPPWSHYDRSHSDPSIRQVVDGLNSIVGPQMNLRGHFSFVQPQHITRPPPESRVQLNLCVNSVIEEAQPKNGSAYQLNHQSLPLRETLPDSKQQGLVSSTNLRKAKDLGSSSVFSYAPASITSTSLAPPFGLTLEPRTIFETAILGVNPR